MSLGCHHLASVTCGASGAGRRFCLELKRWQRTCRCTAQRAQMGTLQRRAYGRARHQATGAAVHSAVRMVLRLLVTTTARRGLYRSAAAWRCAAAPLSSQRSIASSSLSNRQVASQPASKPAAPPGWALGCNTHVARVSQWGPPALAAALVEMRRFTGAGSVMYNMYKSHRVTNTIYVYIYDMYPYNEGVLVLGRHLR